MPTAVRHRVNLESQLMDNGYYSLRLRWTENGKRKAKSCGLGSFEVDPLEGTNSRRKGIRQAGGGLVGYDAEAVRHSAV